MAQASSGATPIASSAGAVNTTPSVNVQGAASTREYLNARIAPLLKKAITQTLDSGAEFPLQYLGECLIRYSLQYEGNPDNTGIQAHFKYALEEQKQTESATEMEVIADNGPQTTEATPVGGGQQDSTLEQTQALHTIGESDAQQPVQVNGHVPEEQNEQGADTEMEGIT